VGENKYLKGGMGRGWVDMVSILNLSVVGIC